MEQDSDMYHVHYEQNVQHLTSFPHHQTVHLDKTQNVLLSPLITYLKNYEIK